MASLLLVATAGVAQAALTVDGSIADWAAADKFSDTNGTQADHCDIREWGAKFEGGYLYWFMTIERTIDLDGDGVYDVNDGDMDIFTTDDSGDHFFPGLWIDADGLGEGDTGDTHLLSNTTWAPDYNVCTDLEHYDASDLDIAWANQAYAQNELHEGVDINIEYGTDGPPQTGSFLNYWGGSDDNMSSVFRAEAEQTYAFLGSTYEARAKVTDLWDALQDSADDVVHQGQDIVWKVGMGLNACAGTSSGWTWGYDVTIPQTITLTGDLTMDGLVNVGDLTMLTNNWTGTPSGAAGGAVPEPVTLSMLALGGLALLRRRR
jgi:hypothetical protein